MRRVLYLIGDDDQVVVTVTTIMHRADACRHP